MAIMKRTRKTKVTKKRRRGLINGDSSEKKARLFKFNEFEFNDIELHLHIIFNNSDSSCDAAKNKTLRISSHFVAAKSPFFYKLLSNGIRESQHENDLSLTINSHEEEALMDVINFMYENTLKATSSSDLVDVLVVTDKFEVTLSTNYCAERLLKLPMSLAFAHNYLVLPSCVLLNEIVRPITKASIRYLAENFEDIVKLKEALACPDFDQSQMSKLVHEVLFYIAEHPKGRHILTRNGLKPITDIEKTYYNFLGRVYSPICELYFCIPRNELNSLPLSGRINIIAHEFILRGKHVEIFVQRSIVAGQKHLSAYVRKVHKGEAFNFDCEFGVMTESSMEYQTKFNIQKRRMSQFQWSGSHNLLGVAWTDFIRKDSDYFVNDIFHLRISISLCD